MARQKCRLDGNGEFFFQGADHPQHFQFCFSRQSVSAFDFDGPRAGSDRLLQSVAGIGEQIGFGHRLQRTGRIQNSAAFRGNFLVALPSRRLKNSPERLAQTPGGCGCRTMQAARICLRSPPPPIRSNRQYLKRVHGPEVHNDSVFNGQPRLLEHRQGAHLSAFQIRWRRIVRTHQPFDVLPEHSHGRKVAIPARVP